MKINAALLVLLSLALNASPALAEENEEAEVTAAAPVATDCTELRRLLNQGYADRKSEISKEVSAFKKIYATALAPLSKLKAQLGAEQLAEIQAALSEGRPVDERIATLTANAAKGFDRVDACKKGYAVRIGDERELSAINKQTYCVRKDNEYDVYLPAQKKLSFAQGRIAMDTSSALGKNQLVQDGCPGSVECFIKIESAVTGSGEGRKLELTLELSRPELNVRPSQESILSQLDPVGVLSLSREAYIDAMLRDTLARPDCAQAKEEIYEAIER